MSFTPHNLEAESLMLLHFMTTSVIPRRKSKTELFAWWGYAFLTPRGGCSSRRPLRKPSPQEPRRMTRAQASLVIHNIQAETSASSGSRIPSTSSKNVIDLDA